MGLCYSLRPLLFGDPEDSASDEPADSARASPALTLGADAARLRAPRGAGGSPARARPKAVPEKERRRRPDQLRAEEREAEREARRVSRGIDLMLREQKRDLQRTHRLLLLGRCYRRPRAARARKGKVSRSTSAPAIWPRTCYRVILPFSTPCHLSQLLTYY